MSNKLKCVKHDRRILATATSFLHKTGDCSPCDSKTATIHDMIRPVGHRDFSNGDWIMRFDNDENTQRTQYPESYED